MGSISTDTMGLMNVLFLFGGLGLFLYGMKIMGEGLELAAGSKLRRLLEVLTNNKYLGALVGFIITAVIQSSSATTVMVVGFVNAGLMNLTQAVGVIMGANIGTTVTGILISLKLTSLAPVAIFLGVIFCVFSKKKTLQHVGMVIAGFGVLFLGMDIMSTTMAPLKNVPAFTNLFQYTTNPLIGILVGMLVTALIQSSSASIGIMLAMSAAGVITGLDQAIFILYGQNIGTCITAVLASIGTSRSAKRATIIHLMFNVIGTVIFTFLFILFPIAHVIDGQIPVAGLSGILPSTPAGQIALVHTSFNIVTNLLLLPLGNYLAKAAVRILPDRPGDEVDQMHLEYLTPIQISSKDGGLGVSAIYVDQMQHELRRMMLMAQGNVEASFRSVLNRDENELAEVEKTEEYIDFLNKEISLHVSRLIAYETNEKASAVVSSFFTISGNIERIGDHADNLAGYTRLLNKRNISFSPAAQKEIAAMRDICLECVDYLLTPVAGNVEWLSEVSALEQRIDDMTSDYRRSHLERMRSGECSDEACIIYSELLTDFERIGDHVLNIAQEMAQVQEHI